MFGFGFATKKDFAECFKNDKDYQIALFAVKRFESALKQNMIDSNGSSCESVFSAVNAVSHYLYMKYNADSEGKCLNRDIYFSAKKTIGYIADGKFETSDFGQSTIYTLLKKMYDEGGYALLGEYYENEDDLHFIIPNVEEVDEFDILWVEDEEVTEEDLDMIFAEEV